MRLVTTGLLLTLLAWPACAQTAAATGGSSSATPANGTQNQQSQASNRTPSGQAGQASQNGSASTPASQDNSMTTFDVNGSSANDAMGGMH